MPSNALSISLSNMAGELPKLEVTSGNCHTPSPDVEAASLLTFGSTSICQHPLLTLPVQNQSVLPFPSGPPSPSPCNLLSHFNGNLSGAGTIFLSFVYTASGTKAMTRAPRYTATQTISDDKQPATEASTEAIGVLDNYIP